MDVRSPIITTKYWTSNTCKIIIFASGIQVVHYSDGLIPQLLKYSGHGGDLKQKNIVCIFSLQYIKYYYQNCDKNKAGLPLV